MKTLSSVNSFPADNRHLLIKFQSRTRSGVKFIKIRPAGNQEFFWRSFLKKQISVLSTGAPGWPVRGHQDLPGNPLLAAVFGLKVAPEEMSGRSVSFNRSVDIFRGMDG
ncbi:MAG TPA: hypothetical protein DCR87_06710 [Acidobacteria bacterium]|nr:hypothetical protein [Acidobacteriota bacterium]